MSMSENQQKQLITEKDLMILRNWDDQIQPQSNYADCVQGNKI